MKKILPIAIICLFLDQFSKLLIVKSFKLYQGIVIIPKFFTIIHVENKGAAWSILDGNRLFLIITSLLALIVLYLIFIKNKKLKKYETVLYGVLIGGILGNLLDRIVRGYVVDFLDFQIFKYNFPVFNIADTFIVLSVLGILLTTLRGDKNDESTI